MSGMFDSMVSAKIVKKEDTHVGLGRSLNKVDVRDKLYLLCHGHSQLPLFSTTVGKWSADELADRMVSDGLKTTLREIEMLVCHAGESITTKSAAKERMTLYHRFLGAKTKNDQKAMNKIAKKFDSVVSKGPKPSFFTHENQVVPLCAQFVQSLKNRGFQYIRVTAYKCPVAQYFGDGKVHLDLKTKGGAWGVEADSVPEYRVVWL